MTDAAHDYHTGDQNITEQLATFSLFKKLMKWGSLAVAVLLVALVLWFCVGAGFFPGLVSAVIVLALGIYFLRSRPVAAH